MTEPEEQENGRSTGNDRRQADRRRVDRRAPPPVWRRPAAFVAYGVLGALAVVLVLRAIASPGEAGEPLEVSRRLAPPAVDPEAAAIPQGPPIDAHGLGGFERLVAEGQDAEGQLVRTELYCSGTRVVSLRDAERVHPAVAALADGERRVPAADCKWSADQNAPNFMLLVPPDLAERFAEAPRVRQGFVTRRRIEAELIWLGRPEALALRTAGVLLRLEG